MWYKMIQMNYQNKIFVLQKCISLNHWFRWITNFNAFNDDVLSYENSIACKNYAYNADISYKEKLSAVFSLARLVWRFSVPLSASTMIWFYVDRLGIVFSLKNRLQSMSIPLPLYGIIILKYSGSSGTETLCSGGPLDRLVSVHSFDLERTKMFKSMPHYSKKQFWSSNVKKTPSTYELWFMF